MSNHEMLDLVPLYALDALEGEEQDQFEAHPETCGDCQASLDDYGKVASNLVHDEPVDDDTCERISATTATEGEDGAEVVEMPRSRLGNGWKWLTADQVADQPGIFVGDFLVEEVAVARVILSNDGRGFVIPTDKLDPLDETRTYRLWVINDAEDVISAGVLGNEPDPAIFTWTGEVTGFALTREDAGGVVSSEGDVVSVIADS